LSILDRFKSRQLKDKPKSSFKELGASGVQFFDGMISGEEYLTELQGTKGIDVYDRMRRSDAQVRGTLYAITLPIRQAKWFVEPASEKPIDIEIAERIEKNLFTEMIITWDDFLRQALGYLTFGFSVFEKVLAVTEDNKILLKKLAPRLQGTIYRWRINDNGQLTGIQQYVQKGDNGRYEYIDIPVEKLALFINEQEGANFEGISVLRSAYKHWYIKDELYKIDAIGHDRWSSGIPVLGEPESANDGDRSRVATILSNLHSREKSYVHKPHGWEFEMFEKSGSNESIIKSISHHNEEIAKNVLAQFINLGTSGSGSRALGESFEELFMQSLNAVAGYVSDNMNRYVIRQLVDLNWNVTEYPRLKASRIMLNLNKWLDGLAKVGLGNAVTRDNEIENVLRDTLGFPELSEETIAKREEMRQNIINGGNNNDDESNGNNKVPVADSGNKSKSRSDNGSGSSNKPDNSSSTKKRTPDNNSDGDNGERASDTNNQDIKKLNRRECTDIEKQLADFDVIELSMDNGVDKFVKQVMKIKKQQAEFLAKEVLKKTADKIKVPYVDKMAEWLYKEQKKNVKSGQRNQRDEINQQKANDARNKLVAPELLEGDDFEESAEVDQFLRDKSKADSVTISNKTLGIAFFGLYNMDPTGLTTEQKEKQIFDTIMTTGNSDITNIASASVNKAYGLGRNVQANKMAKDIDTCVYSAALDANTCSECEPKDGQTHELGDPEFQTPNPECLGGDKCRCVTICKVKG
jgi:hypothetical protein